MQGRVFTVVHGEESRACTLKVRPHHDVHAAIPLKLRLRGRWAFGTTMLVGLVLATCSRCKETISGLLQRDRVTAARVKHVYDLPSVKSMWTKPFFLAYPLNVGLYGNNIGDNDLPRTPKILTREAPAVDSLQDQFQKFLQIRL